METTTSELNNNETKEEAKEDLYEDDFEPESTLEEKPEASQSEPSPSEPSQSPFHAQRAEEFANNDTGETTESMPPPIRVSSPTETEKGQLESESNVKEDSEHKDTSKVSENSDNEEGELDADAYNFTEDQKRAMMELMVQKQEDVDLLDEEPPEYDVKDRIVQLNAELANEPQPNGRETKVGFKEEIVDLVAPPPPDYSEDDDSRPNSARGEPQPLSAIDKKNSNKNGSSEDLEKKQYVVERDGNFEVVSSKDMTAEERALYVQTDEKNTDIKTANDKSRSGQADLNQNNNSHLVPMPPSRPRPNTAAAGPRRNVRQASSPRPKSASHSSHSNSSLDNFRYNSPYAMTTEQKEQAREIQQRKEEESRAKEKRKKEEEEKSRHENHTAFEAWLASKKERDGKRSQKNSDDDKNIEQRREENIAAFNDWVKEKRQQGKKEKLLKRRQQQEQMEGFIVRPREECDKAFREWLRKKDIDFRRQQAMDKQRSKVYRMQARKSRKTSALVRALKDSQAFRYIL